MCLAETTTPAPKNDSLNGLSSFALTFFPVCCTLQAVRVCDVPVHGVWRVCSVCMCMACVHVCACAWCVACVQCVHVHGVLFGVQCVHVAAYRCLSPWEAPPALEGCWSW
jgi:hypothetical protein